MTDSVDEELNDAVGSDTDIPNNQFLLVQGTKKYKETRKLV
jgi:hypothetical protein